MHDNNRHVLASRAGLVATPLTSMSEAAGWTPFWRQHARHLETDIDFYAHVLSSRPEVRGPYLLGALDENGPCGLLIGRLENSALPLKAGYVTLGHLPVRQLVFVSDALLGEASAAQAELFLGAIERALQLGHADVAVLENLRPDSLLSRACEGVPRARRALAQKTTQHWRGTVPSSGEDFLQKLSKRHRYKLRHAAKALEARFPGQLERRRYEKPEDVAAFCTAAETIARTTYQRGLGVGFIDNAQCRALVQLSADRGWWAAWTLSVGERPVAFWAGMVYGGVYYVEWTAYDPAFAEFEPGSVLFLTVVDWLGKMGVKRIDFGIGAALYKERFGDELTMETSFRMFAPGLKGATCNLCYSSGVAIERWTHQLLARVRVADRLKRYLRTRAEAKAARTEGAHGMAEGEKA